MYISEIWLVCESDGLKVKVRFGDNKEYVTVIHETKVYNADGSNALISHCVHRSGLKRRREEAIGPLPGKGGE